jgi:hypothetical protein
MTCITGEYLLNIIARNVQRSVHIRRHSQYGIDTSQAQEEEVTNEELADFILSIPYFDDRLKNFILGDSNEKIIISQSWEIAFMVRATRWTESEQWLNGSFKISNEIFPGDSSVRESFLTLPY